jgi:two-component system sensor histidine kinase KdpD
VDELLGAGINVFTTGNVQHLARLNDVVGGITGVRVWETVPDHVFDEADEVMLVDLPPEELLQRLKEGKIYLPHQAERAIRNFFRKGNLIALRELSLRRTADRVDGEMRAYRRTKAVQSIWQTRESLLVCVGPGQGSERVIRNAARLATQMEVEWHAIYVETPRLQRLPKRTREQILQTLKLAKDLGAETATLPAEDAAAVTVAYAREHNLTKVVVGRDLERHFWRRSFAERIGRLATDLDVIQVARNPHNPDEPDAKAQALFFTQEYSRWPSYAKSVALCVLVTFLATPLRHWLELTNIVMIFLLVVMGVALRLGRGPAVLAAFLSVAFFDFFFVPPRFSFAVSDVQYLLTFVVMLSVALVIAQLMANLRYQARVAMNRERRARALYEAARDLSATLMAGQIAEICVRFADNVLGAKTGLLLMDNENHLQDPVKVEGALTTVDTGIAQWSFDHGEPAGLGTDTLAASPVFYLPLKAPMRTRGVLAIEPRQSHWLQVPEQRRLLDTFASLAAIAIERIHYVDVAQEALVKMESERLRNSVLSVLSHDLRTPLTALVGLSDTLGLEPLSGPQQEAVQAIHDEAVRMGALVNNLLDMARLQSGEVKLKREWQLVEEVIGSALKASTGALAGREVRVELPEDLPFVEFDAVLIERVLCNLLENAGKYTEPQAHIVIRAQCTDQTLNISVCDDGQGFPVGTEDTLFDKFTRGRAESAVSGVGLGLAICRAIISAHQGRIWAEHAVPRGSRFTFSLPLGTPPDLSVPPEAEA